MEMENTTAIMKTFMYVDNVKIRFYRNMIP